MVGREPMAALHAGEAALVGGREASVGPLAEAPPRAGSGILTCPLTAGAAAAAAVEAPPCGCRFCVAARAVDAAAPAAAAARVEDETVVDACAACGSPAAACDVLFCPACGAACCAACAAAHAAACAGDRGAASAAR
jgi:hypothetical protein